MKTILLLLLSAFPVLSQSPQLPQDAAASFSLDSLQRVIARRILGPADKQEMRSCQQEKSRALQLCRERDPARAQVDSQINQAKRSGGDPNDPAIQALMERKFNLERSCDEAFNAKPAGKRCLAGEAKRRKALEQALKRDPEYRKLSEALPPAGSQHL